MSEKRALTSRMREEARTEATVRLHIASLGPQRQIGGEGVGRAARVVSQELGLVPSYVETAFARLVTEGILAQRPGAAYTVLDPNQPHPDDLPIQQAIRSRIAAGRYEPGTALPTGLLGAEFDHSSVHVARACRHLTLDGTLVHDANGPHGPGFYIPEQTALAASGVG
ncbi:hypothetical protein [Streptomyces sp. NPDC054865]